MLKILTDGKKSTSYDFCRDISLMIYFLKLWHTVWKNEKFTLTKKIFTKFLSKNHVTKFPHYVKGNFSFLHTVEKRLIINFFCLLRFPGKNLIEKLPRELWSNSNRILKAQSRVNHFYVELCLMACTLVIGWIRSKNLTRKFGVSKSKKPKPEKDVFINYIL